MRSDRLLFAVALAVAAYFAPAPAAAAPPLKVGMELAYPPFEMTDAAGKPTGVSVRIAEALGKHLERDVVIENIGFDGLIPALKVGKIDCIISSMTATPERAKSIAFSEPYLKTGLALLVGAKSPVKGADDLDVKGRTVAVRREPPATSSHPQPSSRPASSSSTRRPRPSSRWCRGRPTPSSTTPSRSIKTTSATPTRHAPSSARSVRRLGPSGCGRPTASCASR